MDFHDLAEQRYSVRAYTSKPVADDTLRKVLSAAVLAPTACNRQPFRLLMLPTAHNKVELLRIYSRAWFVQAPWVLCMVAVLSESWTRRDGVNYAFVDAAIAFDHLTLAAAEQGLGTCWVAAFDPSEARRTLGLPDGVEPVAFTPIGYPADQPCTKERRTLDDLVRWGHW